MEMLETIPKMLANPDHTLLKEVPKNKKDAKELSFVHPRSLSVRFFPEKVSEANLVSYAYFGQFDGCKKASIHFEDSQSESIHFFVEFSSELSASLALLVLSTGCADHEGEDGTNRGWISTV